MTRMLNAKLEQRLRQALRDKIGEHRYQTWFASTGAQFELRADALAVKVEKEFLAQFLRDTFSDNLSEVVREISGASLPVVCEFTDASPSRLTSEIRPLSSAHADPTSEPSSALAPFPPAGNSSGIKAQRSKLSALADGDLERGAATSSHSELASQSATLLPETSAPAAPVKRKRGRPRKNPLPETANPATPTFPQNAPVTPSVPQTFLDAGYVSRIFAPGGTVAPQRDYPSSVAPTTELPQDPPKRKRGRPRKNPAPIETPPTAPTLSFADSFNRSALEMEDAVATQKRRTVASGLSLSEQASGNVGEFDEAPQTPVAPRRRGRPKGSVAKKPAETEDSDAVVYRDANGYNVTYVPSNPKPRIKGDDAFQRKFASLSSFVVGPSNNTAFKILDLVISSPAMMTPVYLAGGASVGKTHLLEGLCSAYSRIHAFASKPPLYMTSEQFTTAFIRSLQGGASFRDRFRNISLFALDDLQFLEGKNSTQTELVYVLDYLANRGVQVVVTGNRPLSDLVNLREELVTRIQSGVYVEILPPERETLAVILQRFAWERNLVIPEDVSRYVVSRFATHAREISGAVNRLFAAHLTTGAPITLDLARQALADMASAGYRSVRLEDVERVVQETFRLEPNALKSSSRARKNSDPRAIAMWLARKHTRAALAEIGSYFGGRRHSAVLSAQKKVEGWLHDASVVNVDEADMPVADIVKTLERTLAAAR